MKLVHSLFQWDKRGLESFDAMEGLASTKTSRPVAKPSTLSSYSSLCAHACRMSSPALVGLAVSPLWNVVAWNGGTVCMSSQACTAASFV